MMRSTEAQRRLWMMPFGHQRYATRLPSAKASGVLEGQDQQPRWIVRNRSQRISAHDLRHFLSQENRHPRRDSQASRDGLPDFSGIAGGAPFGHREDDVPAVQHGSDVAMTETLEELPKVRHGDALGLADIDSTKKRHPPVDQRCPSFRGAGARFPLRAPAGMPFR
jgi:hypothetical protein